jgi:hypothetical protein
VGVILAGKRFGKLITSFRLEKQIAEARQVLRELGKKLK